jgi:predicted permease
LNGYSTPRIKAFYKDALDRIRALPGVISASCARVPLLHGFEWDSSMSVEGHRIADGEDMQAFMNSISPGYFRTMQIPVLEGRDFDERDTGERTTAVIVNRKFATHFFGNKSAVGRHVGYGTGPSTKLDMEIVGVVEDSMYEGPREGVHRQAFVSQFQGAAPRSAAFYVRTSMNSRALFAAVREKIREIDPSMPVFEMKTLEGQLDETLSTERLIATLSAAFGVLATVLAALGLYGVLAFVVARRTKEIGLRMALGARPNSVVWMVMREALLLLAFGLAVGIPAALILGRYVSSQLFGVMPADIWTTTAALVVLTAVAAIAGFLPARRASSIDPLEALRYE